jgi:hypothetical protein
MVDRQTRSHLAMLGMGIGLGVALALASQAITTPVTAQAPTRLFGTHPTTGAAVPILVTAEGYLQVAVQ